MKKYLIVAVLILALSMPTYAKKMQFDIDIAKFKADSGKVFLDVYYSFPDTGLKYKMVGSNSFLGELYANIEISSNSKVEYYTEWIVEKNKSQLNNDGNVENMFGLKTFKLDPGQYKIKVTFKDINDTTTKGILDRAYVVPSFNDNVISQSDLELAYSIKGAQVEDSKSPFLKGTNLVFPNASLEIASKEPALYAYSEIYNAKKFSPKIGRAHV